MSIKLVSSEGEILTVKEEVAIKSMLIKNMIEDTGGDDEIPLPNLRITILKKIMEYCEYHKNDNPAEIEKPLRTTNLAELVDSWDAKFIDVESMEELFEII
jgi:S-phase kinase-associated protein 1